MPETVERLKGEPGCTGMNTSMKKKLILVVTTVMVMASSAFGAGSLTAYAGQWKQDVTEWWYQFDSGTYPVSGWQWIDGECYYFDENGYTLNNTRTPEGYVVDATGAWNRDDSVDAPYSNSTHKYINEELTLPYTGISTEDIRNSYLKGTDSYSNINYYLDNTSKKVIELTDQLISALPMPGKERNGALLKETIAQLQVLNFDSYKNSSSLCIKRAAILDEWLIKATLDCYDEYIYMLTIMITQI